MDDIIGQRPYARLDAGRQCSATSKTTGQRCRRAPIVGGFVCDHHGGKIPAVRASARERLLAMVDPAMDALLRAMSAGVPCEACGRTDADRDPVVIRAAQIVLDRCGFGPQTKLEVSQPGPDLSDLSADDLVVQLETLLDVARDARDRECSLGRSSLASQLDDGTTVDAIAFEVKEDAEAIGSSLLEAPTRRESQ